MMYAHNIVWQMLDEHSKLLSRLNELTMCLT